MKSEKKYNYRYPGIRSFDEGEQDLFFGREKEVNSLFDNVKSTNVNVVFAKSGIGKTSLINAGLIPKLEDENGDPKLVPIKIRFQSTDITPIDISPVDIVLKSLAPFLKDKEYLNRNAIDPNAISIWESVKACKFKENNEVPLFILDQFEELFNHELEKRKLFSIQIADLVNSRLPNQVREKLRDIPRKDRTEEQLKWFSEVDAKLLFVIRSDKLHLMDEMTPILNFIFKSRFNLMALKKEQAINAIKKPADIQGDNFKTKPFRYGEDLIDEIVANLSNQSGEIESFQLQILCKHIEDKIEEEQVEGIFDLTVDASYLNGKEGIKEILNNYYENQIIKIGSEEERLKSRKLIEEDLIADGQRVGLSEIKVIENISEELLSKLLESRLIRVSNSDLGRSIEISHDTLVEPILESYEKRKLIEEEKQIKEEILAEEKKANEARELAHLKKESELKKEAEEKAKIAKKNANKAMLFAVLTAVFLVSTIYSFNDLSHKYEEIANEKAKIEHLNNIIKNDYRVLDSLLTDSDVLHEKIINEEFTSDSLRKEAVKEKSKSMQLQSKLSRKKSISIGLGQGSITEKEEPHKLGGLTMKGKTEFDKLLENAIREKMEFEKLLQIAIKENKKLETLLQNAKLKNVVLETSLQEANEKILELESR